MGMQHARRFEVARSLTTDERKVVTRFLDDLTSTAGKIEKKARKNGKKATKAVVPSKKDIKGVRDQVKDLSKQTQKLAKVAK